MNKISYFTQAYVGRSHRIIRFLNQNQSNSVIKSLGSKINLILPEQQINSFYSSLSSSLNQQGDKTISLIPISTNKENEYLDVLYKEENIKNYKNTEDPFKYFNFDDIVQGQVFNYTVNESNIEYIEDTKTIKISNYTTLKDKRIIPSLVKDNLNKIGMISESTGIGFLYQIINSLTYSNAGILNKIKSYFKDQPAVSLIYSNTTADEICFSEDLFNYSYNSKIIYYPFLKYPKENFPYGKGNITKNDILNLMPDNRDSKALILVSGNTDFCLEISSLLDETGFVDGSNVFYSQI